MVDVARLRPEVAYRSYPNTTARRVMKRSALVAVFAFIAGLVAAPVAVRVATGSLPPQAIETGGILLAVAGLLVGFGSVWGSGCTSGHGVCGIARLSPRSIAATCIFTGAAIVVVALSRHLIGG